MSRRGVRDLDKERFWRRMVRLWRRSGDTVRDFCTAHRLAEPSFYGWRRVIAKRDQERSAAKRNANAATTKPVARAGRAKSTRQADDATLPAFVPVQVIEAHGLTAGLPLEVVLANQRVVRVPPGFDAVTLRQLLAVLEGPSC